MQSCLGHVEIDISKASTGTLAVTPPATVPGPVGNIRYEGLDGSRWDFCGPRDTAVEKVKGYCYCVSHFS